MDIVTMILACSLYPDNSIVNAMAQTSSHDKPFIVTVSNGAGIDSGVGNSFASAEQAARYATEQIKQNHTIDIGLLQIPSLWLKHYQTIPAELFLSCKNMALATKLLNDAETKCSQMSNTDTRACALSMYKTDSPTAGLAYASTVINYAKNHPFSNLEKDAAAADPNGFEHIIPGDAPTNAITPNASKVNPATDPVRKITPFN
jgi:type IV secretion system protein VirB1